MKALSAKAEGWHGALRVWLLGGEEDERVAVRSALAGVTEPTLEIIERESYTQADIGVSDWPDIVMLIFKGDDAGVLSYLQSWAEHTKKPLLFALVTERSPALMRRILRNGADELLFLPLETGEVARVLLQVTETRRKTGRGEGGSIYSVASLDGGVGTTTVAANLALALRYGLEKRVAVVDLDLQNGGMALALHLDPERTIVPLMRLEKTLDSIQLETALTKHPSGVYLLAAPKSIEDAEMVSDLGVIAVLTLMQQLFDFVVVECGSRVDENAVAAWERSDEILYVVDQSLTVARCARRFLDLFERLRLSNTEPRFVLNRLDPQSAITEKDIVGALGHQIYAKLPRADRVMERAQLRAQDLWQAAPGSALTAAYEELARRLTVHQEASIEASGGLLARFLSAIGAHAMTAGASR